MKKAARLKSKEEVPAAPKVDERPGLMLLLGERQYLIQKLAAEMSQITKRLDELNQVPATEK